MKDTYVGKLAVVPEPGSKVQSFSPLPTNDAHMCR